MSRGDGATRRPVCVKAKKNARRAEAFRAFSLCVSCLEVISQSLVGSVFWVNKPYRPFPATWGEALSIKTLYSLPSFVVPEAGPTHDPLTGTI